MNTILTTFAAAEAHAEEKTDILTGLGIDFTLLIMQLIAFLILVWALSKFVYPVFMKIIDERQAKMDEAVKAAEIAEKKAEAAQDKVEEQLKKARTEAADIVATAKAEATQMVEKAESQASTRSERIVAEAHEEIQKDILAARTQLQSETAKLVKQAAGYAIGNVADGKLDDALIKKSVQGAKG